MDMLKLLPQEGFPRHTVVNEVHEGRGKGGFGLFSTGILKGQVACWYMGQYLHHSHIGDGKSHAIGVAIRREDIGHVICGRIVRQHAHTIPAGLCGALVNSTEKESVLFYDDDNVQPVKNDAVFFNANGKDNMNRTVGLAAIPMVAIKDIPEGKQLLWSYPVTKEIDMTPCDIAAIIREAESMKSRPRKRAVPVPL